MCKAGGRLYVTFAAYKILIDKLCFKSRAPIFLLLLQIAGPLAFRHI